MIQDQSKRQLVNQGQDSQAAEQERNELDKVIEEEVKKDQEDILQVKREAELIPLAISDQQLESELKSHIKVNEEKEIAKGQLDEAQSQENLSPKQETNSLDVNDEQQPTIKSGKSGVNEDQGGEQDKKFIDNGEEEEKTNESWPENQETEGKITFPESDKDKPNEIEDIFSGKETSLKELEQPKEQTTSQQEVPQPLKSQEVIEAKSQNENKGEERKSSIINQENDKIVEFKSINSQSPNKLQSSKQSSFEIAQPTQAQAQTPQQKEQKNQKSSEEEEEEIDLDDIDNDKESAKPPAQNLNKSNEELQEDINAKRARARRENRNQYITKSPPKNAVLSNDKSIDQIDPVGFSDSKSIGFSDRKNIGFSEEKQRGMLSSDNKGRSFNQQEMSNYLSSTDAQIHPFSISQMNNNDSERDNSNRFFNRINDDATDQLKGKGKGSKKSKLDREGNYSNKGEGFASAEEVIGSTLVSDLKRLSTSQSERHENPLSVSDLNHSNLNERDSKPQQFNEQQNLIASPYEQQYQNVGICFSIQSTLSFLIAISCVAFYGWIIPQYPDLFGDNTWAVFLSVICFEAGFRAFSSRSIFSDFQLFFQVALCISHFFFESSKDLPIHPIMLFGRLLIAIWNTGNFSRRVKGISESLKFSFYQNLEVLGFMVIVLILSEISLRTFSSLQLATQTTESLNLNTFSFFNDLVLKTYTWKYLSEGSSYLSIQLLPYIFTVLFLMKIVGQSLLSVVQKVSQEQTCEFYSQSYKCHFVSIFKDSETIISLYLTKYLYSTFQLFFLIIYTWSSYIIDTQQHPPLSIILLNAYIRFIGIIFPLYEISIDAALSSPKSICKNAIYTYVFFFPQHYHLLALIPFYFIISSMKLFKVLTSHLETLMIDIMIIISITQFLNFSYSNLNIPSFIPLLVQFIILEPALKGIMLRFAEIFELEEDEATILGSLHTQPLQKTDNEQFNQIVNKSPDQQITNTDTSRIGSSVSTYQNKNNILVQNERNFERASTFLATSSRSKQIQSFFYLIISIKEIIKVSSPTFFQHFSLLNEWESKGESGILSLILILRVSVSFIRKRNVLSLHNLILVFVLLATFVVQPLILPDTYLGCSKVLLLACLIPFKNKKLSDLLTSVQRSKSIIAQILIITLACYSILNLRDDSPLFLKEVFYSISVTLLAPAVLVEFQKQQLTNQNKEVVWECIKKKISNFKIQQDDHLSFEERRSKILAFFMIKSNGHKTLLTGITGAMYLTIFVFQLSQLEKYCNYLITGFSLLQISYSLMMIKANGLANLFFSSLQNKVLIFQSILLTGVIFSEIAFNFISPDIGYKIQFGLQLPLLFRTKLMFPIVKFRKCIFRQLLISLVFLSICFVIFSQILECELKSSFLNEVIIFNINPELILGNSYTSLISLALMLILNGIINSMLTLDIIRKFDLNQCAIAKNKYKSLLAIFQKIWDKFKFRDEPEFMLASNIIYFLVHFDRAVEEDEEGTDPSTTTKKNKSKIKKIVYMKRIMKMGIKINSHQAVFYKDFLFSLVAEKFSQGELENYLKDSFISSHSEHSSSGLFQDKGVEETELSQQLNKNTPNCTRYNPIKDQLYKQLVYATWKKYASECLHPSSNSTPQVQSEQDEDSIFLDPNMVPPEILYQFPPSPKQNN